MATARDEGGTLDGALRSALALIDGSALRAALTPEARRSAGEAARAMHAACGGGEDAIGLVKLAFTADLLGSVAVDLAADRDEADRIIGRLESQLSIPRAALGREVLRTGRLLELPVEIALEVALALVMAFAGGDSVSLWTRPGSGELKLVSHAGAPSAPAREVAQAMLARRGDQDVADDDPTTVAIAVGALEPSQAVLIAGGDGGGIPLPAAAAPLMAAAAPLLAALLDRQALLTREDSTDPVVGAVERRLARLRFDLHDGPQQDIHLLAQDLRLFRDQLRPMIDGHPNRDRALGRLDDLEAQLVALDGDLRRLATSVESPFLVPASLPEALRQITDAFATRTGVVPQTRLRGPVNGLSDSQQIALLSLIREALSNIRQHSDAENVAITVDADSDGVAVEIRDDGSGFDPESTLVRAARAGRLGLVGMHERVRMLGGTTRIDSRPGGPTLISATLPPWPGED